MWTQAGLTSYCINLDSTQVAIMERVLRIYYLPSPANAWLRKLEGGSSGYILMKNKLWSTAVFYSLFITAIQLWAQLSSELTRHGMVQLFWYWPPNPFSSKSYFLSFENNLVRLLWEADSLHVTVKRWLSIQCTSQRQKPGSGLSSMQWGMLDIAIHYSYPFFSNSIHALRHRCGLVSKLSHRKKKLN